MPRSSRGPSLALPVPPGTARGVAVSPGRRVAPRRAGRGRPGRRWGLVAVILGGVLPAAGEIRTDRDPDVYFGGFCSFTFVRGTPALDPEVEDAIRAEVAAALAARGMGEIAEGADLLVMTHATRGGPDRLDPERFYYGGHPQNGWGTVPAEASLVVDVLAAASRRLVWRGVLTGSLPQDREGRLRQAHRLVRKLMRRFPDR